MPLQQQPLDRMAYALCKPVSIYITLCNKPRQLSSSSDSYFYKDDLIEHVRGTLFKVRWNGQRRGGRDHLVGPGVGVFFRRREAEPFRWLGYIITEKILVTDGVRGQDSPALYMFGVQGDAYSDIPLAPPAWHNDKGSEYLKRFAQLSRGYSTKHTVQETLSGIVLHES